MQSEAIYICDACGEEIVIPLDLTQGRSQDFVEDCPVCCRPNSIRVEIGADGDARAWAASEQDLF
ncbi:MAG: CPXCG motif-containing cysteine-rich protein [Planctomycetaceae bacterium]